MIPAIKTAEELGKFIKLQQDCCRKAHDDFSALLLRHRSILNPGAVGEIEKLIAAEAALLKQYADYPSLSEFAACPSLGLASRFGATFAVTVLVEEIVLLHVLNVLPPRVAKTPRRGLRHLYIAFLEALRETSETDIISSLRKAVNDTPDAVLMTLASTFIEVSALYGLVQVQAQEADITITATGQRVLLHLRDTMEAIEVALKAHRELSTCNFTTNVVI